MESSHGLFLVALIATLAIVLPVQAQDQEGFISLDCGLSPNEVSPYSEEVTGLQYSSDSDFIKFGKISRIQRSLEGDYLKPDTTVRYFPDGIRNCYHLRVKEGTNYLIRARFVYGNYDGLNINPKFDLYIGPNFWTTLDFEQYETGTWEEIFHIPRSNSLDLCLVKTGTSTPFISTLEIRPLPNNSYITTSGSLKTLLRYHLSSSRSYTRYPKDAYDRIWNTYLDTNWRQISTTLSVDTSDSFRLPEAVLKTAALPFDAREPLTNSEFPVFTYDEVFVYLHFAEVQALLANESREFDISLNGESITDSYSPLYLQSDTVHNLSPVTCKDGTCIIKLSKSSNSTHPPLLNAVEMFTVAELPQSETDESDVVAIKKVKASYGLSRVSWQGDPCVPRQFSWDGLICTDTNKSTPPKITYLNLSSSGLTGTIADEIQNLTHLEKLDLSNNKLTGAVPEFLANMKSLLLINLSKNNLKGSIPKALRNREKEGLMLIVDGDEIPCLPGSCVKKKFPVMIVALIASAVVVIAVLLVLFFVLRKKDGSSHVQATPLADLSSGTSIKTKRRRFTYAEVMQMTNNFQSTLGEGGFGMVYHGNLNGSQQVAVKLLSQSSAQGYKEFKAEVELLLRVHHINLVSLVGYCEERDHLALIYEYMSKGDLKHHLLGKHGGSVLSWTTRLRIAVDAALGLEYLHIGCRPSMVHRDVKSTNILLDEQFKAKIADFGLSRSLQLGDESKVSTTVAGTPGYLDPDYYRTSRLAEMSDVYSFGIVLLEIITNQRVINQTREKSHITEWTAFMLSRGDITRIMDPNLHGDYNSRSVWRALELAMTCANPSSDKRPSMSQVVVELKECLRSEISMIDKKQDNDSHGSFEMRTSFDTKDVPSAR